MDFIEFARNYGTDKNDLGYVEHVYSKILPDKDTVYNVLEIGVQQGNSILLWRDYFTKAQVLGVDINFCQKIDSQERITQVVGNAYSQEFISTLTEYDIIIDDGPHTLETMSIFLKEYPSKLKEKGVLILEDIINLNWTPILTKLIDTSVYNISVFNMGGKAKTLKLVDMWKQGLDVIVVTRRNYVETMV